MRFWVIPIIAVLFFSGCSTSYNNSFYKSSFQKISIHTPGMEYALCTLRTGNNKYMVLSPQEITIEQSASPLSVVCEKANYLTVVKNIEPKVFNISLDKQKAGSRNYKYPDAVIVNMNPVINERIAYLEPEYMGNAYKPEKMARVDLVLERVNEEKKSMGFSADIEFSKDDEMYINKEKFKDRSFGKDEIAGMDLEKDKFPDMKISKDALKVPKIIPKVLK